MRILDIEEKFKSEETLPLVLENLKEDLNRIEYLAGLLRTQVANNPEEAVSVVNELTGIYMGLKTVLSIAETEKSNRELKAYETIKIETENKGDKFVSASAEKQASSSVASYRRVRNIIEAYVLSCEKAISTLQSVLKYAGEALKFNKG